VELERMGVPFNRTPDGRIAQRAFGGHTREYGKAAVKRACHAADRTGRVILDTLYMESRRRGLRVYSEFQMVDLVLRDGSPAGIVAYELETGELHFIACRAVLLATGGFGRMFQVTSNCHANSGDGVYLAFRAGVPLQDMEFVQFHPTGLYGLGVLLSEAARGEGGILRNGLGERFMERYAPTIKDLAPRDMVSRAIVTEVREGRGVDGGDYVHLDLTHLGRQRLDEKLSEITSFVRIYLGLEPERDLIPVQPTCHYMMGGIPTDVNGRVLGADQRPLPGLYAAGECACVSVHGANRLGCNSLLDLVVFGRRAGRTILETAGGLPEVRVAEPLKPTVERIAELKKRTPGERTDDIRSALQSTMTRRCSVYRNGTGLQEALDEIRTLKERSARIRIDDISGPFNSDLLEALELESLLGLAEVTVYSALRREESRGAHFREDFPERNDDCWLRHTLSVGTDQGVSCSYKPVIMGEFEPKPRTY